MSDLGIYETLRQYVGSSRGLGIPDEASHQARLGLAGRFLNDHKAERLLDVGCGYGDLRLHVLRCDYLGIDAHAWMIEEAHARQPTTAFKIARLADFTPDPVRFDTVAALGVLSTVAPADLGDFLALLARQANRLMLVSFLPSEPGYVGSFCSHALSDVVGRYRLLAIGQSHGEVTVLLDIAR